jgi:cation diffusion facilitator CzcD-associated flavoprotein CzcO
MLLDQQTHRDIQTLIAQGRRVPRVIIMGAGMSGMCMGIQLLKAGIQNFVIYEKKDTIGGTWRENTYPGLTCDIPSFFYTYSFEPNPRWTHRFPPGSEIQQYFLNVFHKYGLDNYTRFKEEVTEARYEDGRWKVRTSSGIEDSAEFLVSAAGILHHPAMPDIPGLDTFKGAMFHSARFDHSVPQQGKRIGVVGTGSTAVQMMEPLSQVAERVFMFQRTAQWIYPMGNKEFSKRWINLMTRYPGLPTMIYHLQKDLLDWFLPAVVKPGLRRRFLAYLCKKHLDKVRDPVLRAKLTPDYQPGCKRLIMSGTFYDTIQKPNVTLVTDGIEKIEPEGIRLKTGELIALDVMILATGFNAHAYMRPTKMYGENGLSLEQAWQQGPKALRSLAMPGFPNFFMLMGPHCPVGNYSLIAVAEYATNHIMKFIRMFMEQRFDQIAPRPEAVAAFYKDVAGAMPQTIWSTGCKSWYYGPTGQPELWPWTAKKFEHDLKEPNLAEYEARKVA